MKYTFDSIYDTSILRTTSVMFVLGQYPLFNNTIIDSLKDLSKGKLSDEDAKYIQGMLSEFEESASTEVGNTVDLDEFFDYVKTAPLEGKWFCKIIYELASKKQQEKVVEYAKSPSTNGILVVESLEWSAYKTLLNNRGISSSKNTHLIQLSFPNKEMLKQLVKSEFSKRGIKLAEEATDLFIMRMSNTYNEYMQVIDTIKVNSVGNSISYDDMKIHLKNIDNYMMDDFIRALLNPMKNKKIVSSRKIYKMYASLIQSIGAKKLASNLKYKVSDYIAMRMEINRGIVPVMVKYSAIKIQDKMAEDNSLKKLSSFGFKRCAYIASQTTLKDWYYISVILNKVTPMSSEDQCQVALLSLMHRSTFNTSRLINTIGISNIVDESLYDLNGVMYSDDVQSLTRTEDKRREEVIKEVDFIELMMTPDKLKELSGLKVGEAGREVDIEEVDKEVNFIELMMTPDKLKELSELKAGTKKVRKVKTVEERRLEMLIEGDKQAAKMRKLLGMED